MSRFYIPIKKGNKILPDFSLIRNIDTLGLYYIFHNCQKLKGDVSFTNLESVSASGLAYAFSDCSSLSGPISFPKLKSVESSGMMCCFDGCSSLSGPISFPELKNISTSGLNNCFKECSNLSFVSFPSLNSNSFGTYTNQFYRMLYRVTGCTVHFPSNLQSVIGSWSDVTTGFGGTNTTVLFDLPATS